ncbi:hypothetical protein LCGC14_0392360 [marine sediment metagenome]|uniref:Uncharacterized protein n=1 Tax=marine sediment metagenome TaxID=412755 RepID=A0A0F9THD3_9ZZZZ
MAVRSACNGKVLWNDIEIPQIREWSFSQIQDSKVFSSSSTNCAKQRLESVEDSNGTLEFYIEPDDPFEDILAIGDTGTFKLFEDATDFWTVPAIISEIAVRAPIEDGDPVQGTISFDGNGAITPPVR